MFTMLRTKGLGLVRVSVYARCPSSPIMLGAAGPRTSRPFSTTNMSPRSYIFEGVGVLVSFGTAFSLLYFGKMVVDNMFRVDEAIARLVANEARTLERVAAISRETDAKVSGAKEAIDTETSKGISAKLDGLTEDVRRVEAAIASLEAHWQFTPLALTSAQRASRARLMRRSQVRGTWLTSS